VLLLDIFSCAITIEFIEKIAKNATPMMVVTFSLFSCFIIFHPQYVVITIEMKTITNQVQNNKVL